MNMISVPEGSLDSCPGCGVLLPTIHGPVHPYFNPSPACWALYGELLAQQYTDPDRMRYIQLFLDSYAMQHPGGTDRRAVQSVALHGMTLCLFLEEGVDPVMGTRLHKLMVRRPVFHWLESPKPDSDWLNVLDMKALGEIRRADVYVWARGVWAAWHPHHDTIRGWISAAEIRS